MDPLKKKLAAFSVLETMISLMVLILMFGSTMLLFLKVNKTGNLSQKKDVFFYSSELIDKTRKEKRFVPEKTERNKITYEKEINKYKGIDNLYEVKIVAKDAEGKIINTISDLINVNEKAIQ